MKKRSKQYKAVFRAKIDFKQTESHQSLLFSGHSYYLEEYSNGRVSYTDISDEAVWIINNELRPEL